MDPAAVLLFVLVDVEGFDFAAVAVFGFGVELAVVNFGVALGFGVAVAPAVAETLEVAASPVAFEVGFGVAEAFAVAFGFGVAFAGLVFFLELDCACRSAPIN